MRRVFQDTASSCITQKQPGLRWCFASASVFTRASRRSYDQPGNGNHSIWSSGWSGMWGCKSGDSPTWGDHRKAELERCVSRGFAFGGSAFGRPSPLKGSVVSAKQIFSGFLSAFIGVYRRPIFSVCFSSQTDQEYQPPINHDGPPGGPPEVMKTWPLRCQLRMEIRDSVEPQPGRRHCKLLKRRTQEIVFRTTQINALVFIRFYSCPFPLRIPSQLLIVAARNRLHGRALPCSTRCRIIPVSVAAHTCSASEPASFSLLATAR